MFKSEIFSEVRVPDFLIDHHERRSLSFVNNDCFEVVHLTCDKSLKINF